MDINTQTQLCGVLGNPVEHSLSPAIHNAAFQHLGLNYVYLAFRVEQVKEAIQGIRALVNIRGFSVTIPHKVTAMAFLDTIDDTAKHIGAINTIVKTDGILAGYNTDALGALQALRQANVPLSGKQVLIVGSGGAARAIAFGIALHEPIAGITLIGILDDERANLAADLRKSSTIHLTVMDIVYNPRETRLLREAREAGCTTIPGLEMFLHQAIAQFELWTGQSAPTEVMRKILEAQFS